LKYTVDHFKALTTAVLTSAQQMFVIFYTYQDKNRDMQALDYTNENRGKK